MTTTDRQAQMATAQMATTPEMTRLREIEKVRRALSEMQQSTVGSEQEGMACDAVVRHAGNLMNLWHDAPPDTNREPVAPARGGESS